MYICVLCTFSLYVKSKQIFLSRSPHLLLYINNTLCPLLAAIHFCFNSRLIQTFHNIHLILFQMHIYILHNFFAITLKLTFFNCTISISNQSIYKSLVAFNSGNTLATKVLFPSKNFFFSGISIISSNIIHATNSDIKYDSELMYVPVELGTDSIRLL